MLQKASALDRHRDRLSGPPGRQCPFTTSRGHRVARPLYHVASSSAFSRSAGADLALSRTNISDTSNNRVEQRAAELRAAQEACDAAGADEDRLEPVCEHNRFWNMGVEAFDNGVPIGDCPYEGPSVEQDDWLRGWLTAQLDAIQASAEAVP